MTMTTWLNVTAVTKANIFVSVGSWYRETHKIMCKDLNTILCPIILFWDGTSLDFKSRNVLYPLNFSLGIFSTATRRLKEAWKVLSLFPSFLNEVDKKDTKISAQNFHIILRAAVKSLVELQNGPGLKWNFMHNCNEVEVTLKFPLAFINGDTEGHNRIAAKRPQSTHLCRVCKVKTEDSSDQNLSSELLLQKELKDWMKRGEHWKVEALAFHAVKNGLRGVNFGVSKQGLHSALAGEVLHMIHYGLSPYAIKGFISFIRCNTESTKNMIVGEVLNCLHHALSDITQKLKHQSERDLPKYCLSLKFLEQPTLNAFESPAALLSMLIMLVSDVGRRQLLIKKRLCAARYCRFIHLFEMLLAISELFKMDVMTISEMNIFRKQAKLFVAFFKDTVQRTEGKGYNFIKLHLMLHVHMFMSMFGSMANFDSGPGESYHKQVIKTAARRTVKNSRDLNKQT